MLGLYLNNLIIGHKSCNMLSIPNELPLQKKLQKIVTNVFIGQKSKNTTPTQQKNQHKKPLSEPGIEPGTSRIESGCVTFAQPSQLRL